MTRIRRGFTLVEVVVLLTATGVAACVGSVMQPDGRARAVARQLKDSTQVRGIHQAMVVFAGNNKDLFPLPSVFDTAAQTVDVGQVGDPSLAPLADSTRNIFSILIYQGFCPVEMFISPAEASTGIAVNEGYQFDEPAAAAGNPMLALWDPAFRATPEDVAVGGGQAAHDPGGFSYAHAIPLGGRRGVWANTFTSTEAALGNRGPSYEFTGDGAEGTWSLVQNDAAPDSGFDTPMGTMSNTLLIHGTREAWEGNVVMNDNACHFFDEPAPEALMFQFEGLGQAGTRGLERPDNLFVREDDSTRSPTEDYLANEQVFGVEGESVRNNYLRSYAGGPGAMKAEGTSDSRTFTIDLFLD